MRVFQAHLSVLTLLALGCDAGAGSKDDTDGATDTDAAVAVDQCTETYTVPGPLGSLRDDAVTPHENTFGATQSIGSLSVSPEPSQVHIGWPGADTSNSISFLWNTDTGTLASMVEWGEGTELDHKTPAISYTYGGVGTDFRVHELKLCGRLKPGTTYSYRVGGEGHWSPSYQFTTPMAPGTFDTFTVAISGDSRGTFENWATIVSKMESHDPDFYLFSGDMVPTGADQSQWLAWWNATGDTFARKVFVPAHGNHEALAANYFAQFSLPNNEQWFSVDFGSTTIVSLNDTVGTRGDIEGPETDFLRAKFAASAAPWKIATHHRAEYSASTGHESAMDLREAWGPVFDEQGADLVVTGHNHLYERSKPIRNGEVVESGAGTVYFVSGGAGAPIYSGTAPEWFNEKTATVEHFLIAEFSPAGVTINAYNVAGDVIDTVTIAK